MEKGLIHIYYGDGKGKTSAAIGLAARALGRGMSVCFAQFLKAEGSGEVNTLRQVNGFESALLPPALPFFFAMTKRQKSDYIQFSQALWNKATSKTADVIIFDELLDAIDLGIIDLQTTIDFLLNKPRNIEVVITGHKPIPKLIELADYVTEFKAHKHPYNKGLKARKGIEY